MLSCYWLSIQEDKIYTPFEPKFVYSKFPKAKNVVSINAANFIAFRFDYKTKTIRNIFICHIYKCFYVPLNSFHWLKIYQKYNKNRLIQMPTNAVKTFINKEQIFISQRFYKSNFIIIFNYTILPI